LPRRKFKQTNMEEQRVDDPGAGEVNYSKADWLWFLISAVILVLLLKYIDSFFWVALPFTLTFFVKALKMM
jgi:hypothetical protein